MGMLSSALNENYFGKDRENLDRSGNRERGTGLEARRSWRRLIFL